MVNNWKGYDKAKPDEDKAHDIAKELTTDPEKAPERNLMKQGIKRKVRGRSKRPPFPGCSIEDSATLRHLVGLKYSGHTMKESFEKVGMNPSSGAGWLASRQDAYAMADHELMELALRGYQSNLWIMRTALSELGPRAVRTLGEIMDSKRESGPTRLKAATAVLKMVDVDHSATGGAQEKMADEILKNINSALTDITTGKIIDDVDAEDAEIIEDGNDGNSVAVQ